MFVELKKIPKPIKISLGIYHLHQVSLTQTRSAGLLTRGLPYSLHLPAPFRDHPFTVQWYLQVSSPLTAAGPCRNFTGFPIQPSLGATECLINFYKLLSYARGDCQAFFTTSFFYDQLFLRPCFFYDQFYGNFSIRLSRFRGLHEQQTEPLFPYSYLCQYFFQKF